MHGVDAVRYDGHVQQRLVQRADGCKQNREHCVHAVSRKVEQEEKLQRHFNHVELALSEHPAVTGADALTARVVLNVRRPIPAPRSQNNRGHKALVLHREDVHAVAEHQEGRYQSPPPNPARQTNLLLLPKPHCPAGPCSSRL